MEPGEARVLPQLRRGALEFCALGEPRACRGRGTVVMFPSFLGHRVTRVTRGRRVALVSWIYGPPFR